VATLTDPIPVLFTPEQRDRVVTIAVRDEVSIASVVRDLVDKALPAREKKSLKQADLLR
jgi:hypothetical protein